MLNHLKSLPIDCVFEVLKSPVGNMGVVTSPKGVHAILWPNEMKRLECKKALAALKRDRRAPMMHQTLRQLREYFSGRRQEFDVPVVLGGTLFQKKVWMELTRIPYGRVLSYQEQAARLGDSKKARAVGTANSKNPVSIIIPCHRVVAKSGALSGFGGGVANKKFLLQLEGAVTRPARTARGQRTGRVSTSPQAR